MALFGGKTPPQLTLTDAITIGFGTVLQPNFVIPILVIGAVVNLIVIAALVPIVVGLVLGSDKDALVIGGTIVASILGAVIAGIVGGLLLNLYGQVWATMASVGEAPTMQGAFARVAERWMSILGAGLITGAISLGIIIVAGIVAALLGPLGALILLIAVIAAIYIAARLWMSGWVGFGVGAGFVRRKWENRRWLARAVPHPLGPPLGSGAGLPLSRKVKGS